MDAKRQNKHYRTEYVDGSTARQLNTQPRYRQEPQALPMPEKSKNPQIARRDRPVTKKIVGRGIDFASMAFLSVVMIVTLFVCVEYLKMQSDTLQMDKTIIALEGDLKAITDKNNAVEIGLETKIDFEEVYQIAVGELGMVFPNKNEIINYEMEFRSHMQQNGEIPEVTEKSVLDQIFQE